MGYIRLYRSLTEWEWYADHNCTRVFMHLLLTCNWKDGRWQGIAVPPGTRICSMDGLAEEVGMTRASLRRAIDKLKSTGEVSTKSASKWTAVTLVNWAKYQHDGIGSGQQMSNEAANKRPTSGQQAATIEEGKKGKREEGKEQPSVDATSLFKSMCNEAVKDNANRLPMPLRHGFVAYWTEADAKGRQRWQGEKFFDVGRRMDTWKRNAIERGEYTDPENKPVWNPRD